MKQVNGWWFPDHDTHIPQIMEQHNITLNGRLAYQGAKQVRLLDLCKSRRKMLDIGAHVGLWSYNMAIAFDEVHAFEPVTEHRECFLKNVEGVHLYDCALGEKEMLVGMTTTDGNSGDTYVQGRGEIPVKRLDDFHFTEVDAIKMDCQGYESRIIDGAMKTILANKPVIVVEEKKGTVSVDKLKAVGYEVVDVIHGDHYLVWADK